LHSFSMTKPLCSLALLNPTMFFPLIMASDSSFCRILHNLFTFTGPYIFCKIFLWNTANALSSSWWSFLYIFYLIVISL
jgi:hypothetical protein